MNPKKVSVLGFGSWGIALSLQLHRNGHKVTAWQRDFEKCEKIRKNGMSEEYLPGVRIPEGITITSCMEQAAGADVVIFAAGSKATRDLAIMYKPFWEEGKIENKIESPIMVSASKGLEPGTNLRMSEVLGELLPGALIGVMSGPCHAEELAQEAPTAYVAASPVESVAVCLQDLFMSKAFRVYTNSDIIGVELGGALKNCIAIAVGVGDGLGHGDNARAAAITRGIAEMSRLGVAMGAKPETFSGLTGIGDLVVTCTSPHSRNRRAGYLLGKGMSLDEVLNEVRMLVEGVNTAKPALDFARQHQVPIPIIEELNKILFEGRDPKLTVQALMERGKAAEVSYR